MQFEPTGLPEVVLIKPKVFDDERGFFFETWQQQTFAKAGIRASFVQDNHSRSTKYTLRGLHFQIQQPQGKLVRCVAGEVLDVAVDIRRASKTFGKAVAIRLSEENKRIAWIPPGFAHGYLALSDEVDLLYKCTDFYAPQYERAICWSDPAIGAQWPLPPGIQPILSRKDAAAPPLQEVETYP